MGLNGAKLVPSSITSVVSGLELTIASTSTTRVCNDCSVKLLPWVFSNEFRIERALLICRSHTPPILLACGGFLFHTIQSPPFSSKKLPIFLWSIFWKTRISSADSPIKFGPLSDLTNLTIPLLPKKRLKIKMKESVLEERTTSICISLLQRQVYKAPHFLTSFQTCFSTNGPKISTPQYVNGGSIQILSFGKSAIFCCWSCPLNCLHLAHFPIIDRTNELQLMIQNPEDLTWSMVIPLPACATLSWHHRIIDAVVLQDFGNKIGCWISSGISHFPYLPQLSVYHYAPIMDLI